MSAYRIDFIQRHLHYVHWDADILGIFGGAASYVSGTGQSNAIVTQSTPPANNFVLWLDNSTSPSILKHWNGSAWIPVDTDTDTNTFVGASPPTDTSLLWVDNSGSPAILKYYDGSTWSVVDNDIAADWENVGW